MNDDSELSVLRERAAKGDGEAVDELIELAAGRGDMDELRRKEAELKAKEPDLPAE